MKTGGFTLIELLAVLFIIAVVVSITVVSVNSVLSSSEDSISDLQKKNVEEAARVYYLKEGMNTEVTCVSVEDLVDKGCIEGSEVTDPKTKEKVEGSVKITYASNQYSYKYQNVSCE